VYPQKQVRHFFGARSTALAADVARRYREHGQ
jgi:hypothetical protein